MFGPVPVPAVPRWARCEHARGGQDVVGVELGALGDEVEGEPRHRSIEFGHLVDPPLAELVVLQPLVEHDLDHAGEQRRVLARADLEMDVGEARQLGAARVDDDQLHALGLAAAHHRERIGALEAADRRIGRDHRVVADRHVDVGVGERVVARLPAAEAQHCQALGRLIDGDGGVEGDGVETLMEGPGSGDGHRVLVATGAGVGRDGARAVGVDDPSELGCDLVECVGAVRLFERAVGATAQRPADPLRVGHLIGDLATLDAGVALEQRIVHHAAYCDDRVAFDVDLHRTTCMADTTERVLRAYPGCGFVRHLRLPHGAR